MPHRLSHRRLHDDEVRASIRKHGSKIARKHGIPVKRLEQAQSDLLGNIVVPGDLAYEKARRMQQKLVAAEPRVYEYRRSLALTWNNVGDRKSVV